jgi:hypothetical protein
MNEETEGATVVGWPVTATFVANIASLKNCPKVFFGLMEAGLVTNAMDIWAVVQSGQRLFAPITPSAK